MNVQHKLEITVKREYASESFNGTAVIVESGADGATTSRTIVEVTGIGTRDGATAAVTEALRYLAKSPTPPQ